MIKINYFSNFIIPIFILIIILEGIKEKKNIFDLFLEGAKDGINITYKLFPTLIGLFFLIGLLKSSGVISFLGFLLGPITSMIGIPNEILPLALLRPVSGSASIAMATEIMKQYGVDNYIGKVASVLMGSTETTLYAISVYTSCVKIKDCRKIIIPALIADLCGIICSVIFCKFL